MSRSLKYEIPGVDPRVALSDVAEKGWPAVFDRGEEEAGAPADLVLEIGFGRGEFLLELATRSPETNFVGVEISFKRALKMARKVARAELRNVRLIEGRAEVVLRELFDEASLSQIWVNFSDPWPKHRHAHRRVLQAPLVADVARRLRPGGSLRIATDDVPYAHQIDSVLRGEAGLVNLHAPFGFVAGDPSRIETGYEVQWRAAGRPIHFFDYARPGAES